MLSRSVAKLVGSLATVAGLVAALVAISQWQQLSLAARLTLDTGVEVVYSACASASSSGWDCCTVRGRPDAGGVCSPGSGGFCWSRARW